MKPNKPSKEDPKRSLFRSELVQIIDPVHPLVKLSEVLEWDRMDRNRLKGVDGDRINATLSATGMNFSKLMSHLLVLFRRIIHRLFFYLSFKRLYMPSLLKGESFSIMYQSINSMLALEYPLKNEFFRTDYIKVAEK